MQHSITLSKYITCKISDAYISICYVHQWPNAISSNSTHLDKLSEGFALLVLSFYNVLPSLYFSSLLFSILLFSSVVWSSLAWPLVAVVAVSSVADAASVAVVGCAPPRTGSTRKTQTYMYSWRKKQTSLSPPNPHQTIDPCLTQKKKGKVRPKTVLVLILMRSRRLKRCYGPS